MRIPAVVIDGHERERRVHDLVHDRDRETVPAIDRLPVTNARAAERIDRKGETAARIASMSMTLAEIVDVRRDEIVRMRRRRLHRGGRATRRTPWLAASRRAFADPGSTS
jgi:hypothetical protein